MRYRQQSAIEFISVYGLVLLIIAIALSMLVFIAAIPRTILPTQCAYYNTFTCPDAVLSTNSTGSMLLVDSVDSTPGIVNISSFSAFIGSGNSRSGYCVPSQAQQGQTVYCIANFNFSLSTGTAYTGTFSIHANYCTGPPSTLLSASCPAGSNYSFAGSIRIQPSHAIIGGINTSLSGGASGRYVPITITNNQPGAAPAHFQQMITFDPQTYAQFERADLGNLRFYYGSKEMYSWCESGCSSSSASAVFWVRMPVAIPSQGSRVIDMYFLPFSVQYDGIYTGESPQFTTPYAEYDNGASVFNSYWNFAGTSSAGWTTGGTGSGTFNNGLTLDSNGQGPFLISTTTLSSGSVIEGLMSQQVGAEIGIGTVSGYVFDLGESGSQELGIGITSSTGEVTSWVTTGSSATAGTEYVVTGYYTPNGNLSLDYVSELKGSLSPSTQYITISGYSGLASTSFIQWLRTRTYPPNGIMPSVTFGSVA